MEFLSDLTCPACARSPLTDVAGAFGAIVAALCCAGTPLIVAALTATGLSAMRKDAILWPIMLVSLAVAIWGYWQGHRMHRAYSADDRRRSQASGCRHR